METNYGVRKQGVIPECILLLMGFWFAALPLILKKGVKINHDYSQTKPILILILVFYSFMLLSLFAAGESAGLYVVICAAPILLTAILIFKFRAAQKPYEHEVAKFIQLLSEKKAFSWTELNERFPMIPALKMLKPSIVASILKDFKSNRLIDYTDDKQIVRITYVNPCLGLVTEEGEWECPNCGARNAIVYGRKTTKCEYCGTER